MEMNINIQLEENEPLGARPNDGLVITEVQEGTPAFGHLQVGDTILAINDRRVSNLKEFYQKVRVAHPVATVRIQRPRSNDEVPPEVKQEANDNLPADIATTLLRRHGYHYQLVQIVRVPGIKFGLAIKTRDNRVIATEVNENSTCSPFLQPYDNIIYVEGIRVTQAEVAQNLLIKAIRQKGSVDLVIGRPVSNEAKQAVHQILSREDVHDPPSVRLNLDVQHVMRKQIIERAARNTPDPPGIYINGPTPTPPSNVRVSFDYTQNRVHPIQSDNIGRALRPVQTTVPNSPFRQQGQQQ